MRLPLAAVYAAGLIPGGRIPRFCILCSGRTGSELLVELLNSHPQIRCDKEILRTHQRWPLSYVRGRARAAQLRGARAYGFKFTSDQFGLLGVEPTRLVRWLRREGFSPIHLVRRNLLRQSLSHLRARGSGRYHVRGDGTLDSRFHVDVIDLVLQMRWIELTNALVQRELAGVEHISMCYEDDLLDADAQTRSVTDLVRRLGLEPVTPRTALHRISTGSLSDDLVNYDEVRDVLGRTRYASYLE